MTNMAVSSPVVAATKAGLAGAAALGGAVGAAVLVMTAIADGAGSTTAGFVGFVNTAWTMTALELRRLQGLKLPAAAKLRLESLKQGCCRLWFQGRGICLASLLNCHGHGSGRRRNIRSGSERRAPVTAPQPLSNPGCSVLCLLYGRNRILTKRLGGYFPYLGNRLGRRRSDCQSRRRIGFGWRQRICRMRNHHRAGIIDRVIEEKSFARRENGDKRFGGVAKFRP